MSLFKNRINEEENIAQSEEPLNLEPKDGNVHIYLTNLGVKLNYNYDYNYELNKILNQIQNKGYEIIDIKFQRSNAGLETTQKVFGIQTTNNLGKIFEILIIYK